MHVDMKLIKWSDALTESDQKAPEGMPTDIVSSGVLNDGVGHATKQQSGNPSEEMVERSTKTRTLSTNTEPEDGTDGPNKQRPMSPGTLSLMCDEQDSTITAPPSPSGSCTGGFPSQRPSLLPSMHAEQERAILTEFRDCLRRVVSVGNKRGMVDFNKRRIHDKIWFEINAVCY